MDHTLKCETAYFFWKFIILEPRNFPRLHKIMFIELFMCIDLISSLSSLLQWHIFFIFLIQDKGW